MLVTATKLQTSQWVVEQVGTELVFKYNGVIPNNVCFQMELF